MRRFIRFFNAIIMKKIKALSLSLSHSQFIRWGIVLAFSLAQWIQSQRSVWYFYCLWYTHTHKIGFSELFSILSILVILFYFIFNDQTNFSVFVQFLVRSFISIRFFFLLSMCVNVVSIYTNASTTYDNGEYHFVW